MENKSPLKHAELPPEKLRWRCDPARVPYETTAQAEPLEGVIGQDRALRALKMGIEIMAPGYNVFVCGLAGTSRGSTITRILEELRPELCDSPDRCYVNNFKNLDRPRLLTLSRGRAAGFKKDMQSGIEFLRRRIPQVFEGEPFQRQKARIVDRYTAREKELMDDFTRRIAREQFALGHMQVGAVALPEIFPVLEGQMVPIEDIPKLVHEGKIESASAEELERKYEQFRQGIHGGLSKNADAFALKTLPASWSYLEQEAASVLLDGVIEELKEKYPSQQATEYLEEVRLNILDNLDPFREREGEEDHEAPSGENVPKGIPTDRDPFRVYGVNVILAHTDEETPPVIFETTPTYANLFGTIQRNYDWRGSWTSDFMDLRGGSMLRADGGYLILYAFDVLTETSVWKTLKRTMNHAKLEIQPMELMFPMGNSGMKPEPIDLKVKVILIGDRDLYELFYTYEEEFRKIFKVRVEFDDEMPMADEVILEFGGRLRKLCDDEGLCPFDRTAVAALIEDGVRKAGRRNKVTARFVDLADLARESCYAARQMGETPVTGEHVRKATESKIERHNLYETKLREIIEEGTLLVDTSGSRVGQVNGLSVLEIGGYMFGKPVRITATAALGKTGLINVEREANLSGRLHDKGMQIIAGYLRRVFAQEQPLSLSASVCFEQSYSGVDGDSASSTEIYALLSALSNLPIRQDIAVTGSVNQQGDIQPIGGVNQKIEGFYDVCMLRGLTGTQGVIIPAANVEDLMLREDVIAAVTAGKFHILPVTKIEEGIEILTGVSAGSRDASGKFQPGTVLALTNDRLHQMAHTMKQFE